MSQNNTPTFAFLEYWKYYFTVRKTTVQSCLIKERCGHEVENRRCALAFA